MALFSLTDIKFKSSSAGGPTSALLPDSRYLSNTLRYPIDVGNTDKGHYMVIHINQQTKTQFPGTTTSDLPTIFENGTNASALRSFASASGLLLSEINNLNSGTFNSEDYIGIDLSSESVKRFLSEKLSVVGVNPNVTEKLFKLVGNAGESALATLEQLSSGKGLRTIERTTDTIALYMPDTLNFTYDQKYSEMNLGGGTFGLLGAAADAGVSIAAGGKIEDVIGKNLSPFILSQVAKGFGDAGIALFASGTGTVINPQLELIYTSPAFRQFRFDFMLYPRSEKEAVEIQYILERLRFHQAPEILNRGSGALGGFFLVPPSEFDIKFYYNGSINPNIPAISTCVLTQIDTDYAPNGFAAYEKPTRIKATVGGTGMPVAIRMSLQFMETQILTKANYFTKYRTISGSEQTRILAEQDDFQDFSGT